MDPGFKKGYIKGVITSALETTRETTLPRRYMKALKEISNKDIYITISDRP